MKKEDIKKVVLAYSGGLDTSIIIPWLKENYNNCEVIAVSGDVGQGTELDGLEEKALKTGASKLYVLDLKKDYVENYIWPCLKADAKYEEYLLGTSHARPCIAKALAEIAKKENADAICHGCTGKTNYSKDKNLWHLSHEGLDLEKPSLEPQYNKPGFLELGVSPEQAPDTPSYVTIHFEKGIPTAVDGKEMDGVALIEYLNKIGGENGIGQLDIVENRLVGMKSRGVYETPAGTILYKAHNVLETITIDKDAFHFKESVAQKMGELVYDGKWFTPLREALSAFTDDLQKTVTGDVKLKLYKGNLINAGVTSPFTLYDEQTASFGEDDDYDQFDANGFINLFGLPIAERAKLAKNWPEVK